MDTFVDLIAILSLPGIAVVVVGQGLIGVGLPFLLGVGMVEELRSARPAVPRPRPDAIPSAEAHVANRRPAA